MTSRGDPAPIVCRLDAGSLAERIEEWRAFVSSSVLEVEFDATSVHLVLRDTEAALVAAASLGQREKQCCEFFNVAIDIGSDRCALTLRVPDGAEEAIATFMAVLTP